MSNLPIIVNPSDFAFLFDRCDRCAWLKVRGIRDTPPDVPKFYQEMDQRMKFTVTPEMLGLMGVEVGEPLNISDRLTSQPFSIPGSARELVIRGKFDKLFAKDGGVAIEEFKTMPSTAQRIEKYRRQVHAYIYCIEHPDKGDPKPVYQAGLTCFAATDLKVKGEAISVEDRSVIPAYLKGQFTRTEIDIDRGWFEGVLAQCGRILASEEMPDSGEGCDACRHAAEIVRYVTHHEKKQTTDTASAERRMA